MKRLAILANNEKQGVRSLMASLGDWALRHDVELISNFGPGSSDCESVIPGGPFGPCNSQELTEKFSGCDLMVTLGGDGTLLYAAQLTAPLNLPVLSVNLGSLGFHTQVSPDNLISALDLVRSGEFATESRLLLQATVTGRADGQPDMSIIGLNDVVISKSLWGHMVVARLSIDGNALTDVAADAVLVASPTGSSAYNYAAGGPVLHPGVEGIILNTICAHRMRLSPLIIPPTATLQVDFRPRRQMDQAQILVDGQIWSSLVDHESLKISRAPMYLPLIVFEDDFYGKLRDKLRWGGLL